MNLNKQQKLAVSHHLGTCVVTAVPGSGKCITGDSWVFSDSQLLSPIRDNNVSTGLSVADEKLNTVNIEAMKIGEFVDSGVKPIVTITTHHGFSISGTEHHPIAILNNEGKLIWKWLSDVQVGDFAAIWCNKTCQPRSVENDMDHPTFFRGLNSTNLPVPKWAIDYSFYLMGLLLGDGSLTVPNCIQFCCQSELKGVFTFLVEKIYDEKVSKYRDKRREDLWNLCVYKGIKSKLIDLFGDIEHGSCNKYLTPQMLCGDKSQVAALIRGIFDTDGHAGRDTCEITLCSKKMIDQLHLLLLHFGIFSYKNTKIVDGNEYYRIQIYGEDYRRFVRNIGFGVSYKKESSEKILKRNSNPNKIIPHMRSVLKSLRSEIRDFKWWDGHTATVFSDQESVCMNRYLISGDNGRNLTETSALKIVSICAEHNFNSDNVSYLKKIAENLYFSPIIKSSCWASIELPTEHVFDYEIPRSHNFIANGFINHNTRVLTSRVVSLIKEKNVDPRNILCLTFTNKASNEMKERILQELGEANIDGSSVWISTFHKLCLAILRKHGHMIDLSANFSIYSSREQEELMGKLARMKGYENTSKYAIMHLIKAVNDFREDIVDFKQHLAELTPTEVEIVEGYQDALKDLNAIDFSGMLYKSWLLLKSNPAVVESMSKRFKFVLVDEMQDTNHVQYELVKYVAGHGNLFVVGDVQQCVKMGQKVLVSLPDCLGAQREELVENLDVGDTVISASGDGGLTQSKIKHVKSHSSLVSETYIKTKSGAELKVTSNHQMFVRRGMWERSKPFVVYLMRRHGHFRIGTTRLYDNKKMRDGFIFRCRCERADSGWLIEYCDSDKQSRILEKQLSYQYGIYSERFERFTFLY